MAKSKAAPSSVAKLPLLNPSPRRFPPRLYQDDTVYAKDT